MTAVYGEAEMNAAIARVETAKQNHPVGWGFLIQLGFDPDPLVIYAFSNADLHVKRLGDEDRRVVYAAGWLNGVGIGAALGERR
jgi:hypothetical protein